MNLPKLAIFDMDGLIFDTERLFMETRAKVMKKYGYVHREEDYIKTIGTAGETLNSILLELYGPEYPAERISQETRDKIRAELPQYGPQIKAGIVKLLEFFEERGVPCCVASSSNHSLIESYLTRSGLDRYFSWIISGQDVKKSKPEPDIFLKACAHYNVEPTSALVLEDSVNGIQAAWNAQIPVICIPDLVMPSDEMAEKTVAVLNAADELIKYF
ncbi:MAG: HAD family phosphatase [Firmicutes bacterium]|nr:HAD family phosphatase [Bacillota bacterium]